MKKLFLLFVVLCCCYWGSAQERIIIYNGSNAVHSQLIDNIDSVSFVNSISIVHNNLGETNFQFPVSAIDSIVFATEDAVVDTGRIVYIIWNEQQVTVINPLVNAGVTVTTNGGTVMVNGASGTQDVTYHLSGTTSNGSLTMNSDHRFNLILSGVSITNPSGAAIKVLDDVKVSLTMLDNSSLTDGAGSTDKAPFDSKGQVVVYGPGTVSVTGNVQHGFYSSDYIRMISGNIQVNGAISDGIHSNDYIELFGGQITVANAKTGIDAGSRYINISGGEVDIQVSADDGKGIKCDSLFMMAAGTLNLTLTGGQTKGIKAGRLMDLQGGTITINGSGATVVTENNPSHCTGIKCDGDIVISAATGGTDIHVTLSSNASGGKGISADGNVTVNGGDIELSVAGAGGTYTNASNQSDSYSAACLKANNNIVINGGNINVTAAGRDSKGIAADNAITVNDGAITMTLSGSASKGFKSDISLLIDNGSITANVSGATYVSGQTASNSIAIKSDGTLNINGGTISATCTSTSGGAKGLSADGNINIAGGNITLSTAGQGATLVGSGTSCTDGYAPSCIKGDANISITGGTINCQSTGTGGRGIVCDGTLTIGESGADNDLIDVDVMTSGAPVNVSGGGGGFPGGGSTSDYWKGLPKGIKVQGNLVINSGHVSSYCAQTSGESTGEAIETKSSLYINGGIVEANAYDDAINASAYLEINGGYVWAYARGNDGIDCNGTRIEINGGTIIARGTEVAIDDNGDHGGRLYVTGGTFVLVGGNMGVTEATPSMTNQKYVSLGSSGGGGFPGGGTTTNVATSGFYLRNSSNAEIMTFKWPTFSGSGFEGSDPTPIRPPGGGGGGVYVSTPDIQSGTYTYFTSPTINGGTSWHGLYSGATVTTSGNGTSVTAQ
ncbi:MAG: carbohydrate-binding domain-containing protein [Bacteroidales bacterium]|nr:carbohydrate-binding domain-containing protein [Bacteroidales bacterium]